MTFNPNTAEEVKAVCAREFAGADPAVHDLINAIIHLRRGEDVEYHLERFNYLVFERLGLLPRLNVRWLVSICDTIADYGEPADRAMAMMIVEFASMNRIFETYVDMAVNGNLNEHKITTQTNTRPFGTAGCGLWTMNVARGDMPANMFKRIREVLSTSQVFSYIWDELLSAIKDSPTAISQLNSYHKNGGYFD